MSETEPAGTPVNPYQATASQSLGGPTKPPPREFIPERLTFEGEVTLAHHRQAIVKGGLRKDLRNGVRLLLVLVLIAGGPLVLGAGMTTAGTYEKMRLFGSAAAIAVGLLAILLRNVWVSRIFLPSNQLLMGPMQGWIDGESLWVETEGYTSQCEMSELVSTAVSRDVWALNFSPEVSLWTTIPLAAFTDPRTAATVANDLRKPYPPVAAKAGDERKQAEPTALFQFEKPDQAISYDGPLMMESFKGSRFKRHASAMGRDTMLILIFALLCLVFGLYLLGMQSDLIAIGGIWFAVFVGSFGFRYWRAKRRAGANGDQVLWRSRGWFAPEGYASMTVIGQSRFTWDFFDHIEITDRLIVLYPHANDACACLTGRSQFADDQTWQAACEMIRRNFRGSLVVNMSESGAESAPA